MGTGLLNMPRMVCHSFTPSSMRIENKDIYKGHLVAWYQMISEMRPAHGRIYNSVDYTAANQIW